MSKLRNWSFWRMFLLMLMIILYGTLPYGWGLIPLFICGCIIGKIHEELFNYENKCEEEKE